ncbi:MAG: prephenate dehydratase [Cytophagales bacterium]|nr:prephenate dehydratase [Cytophagales bacterium]MDW8383413.1 prephenate dehydratase [Flammeovirgaceae bacterium]
MSDNIDNQLAQIRSQIDHIDDQILILLNERMKLVQQVGEIKRQSNAMIYRPEREKAIIDRLSAQNRGLLTKKGIEAVFMEIFAISRNLELPEAVAYLGPEGSFTHQAAESRFGALSEYHSLPNIKAVFDSVDAGRARFGVVPIENNQEGTVRETINLLNEKDVQIVAEIYMPIHFTLASKEDKISRINKIYSKDIAFRQCKNFLDEYFGDRIRRREVEIIEVNSTSKAVEIASLEEHSAAICSQIAAKLYRVPILYDNIEDSTNNRTRFVVIAKKCENNSSGYDKTTIIVKLNDQPGSLADFLDEFRKAKINLSKIESIPAKEADKFKSLFLIDFCEHRQHPSVSTILEKFRENIKWVGSYPQYE